MTVVTFRDVSAATDSIELLLDNVRITPQGSPAITGQPQAATVFAGGTASLERDGGRGFVDLPMAL